MRFKIVSINQLIKSLFSDGTQGLYLNAQDSASIADLSSIKDLSGRNNHAAQPNATSRATIITDPSGYKSLKFDGVDDGYVTPSINFTNTDKVTVIAAVRKLSDAQGAFVCELSSSVTSNNGTFFVAAPNGAGNNNFSFASRATSTSLIQSSTNFPSPFSAVLTANADIAAPIAKIKVNNTEVRTATNTQGTGSYGNYPLYIGRRGGAISPFNGQIYALLVIGKLLDDATTARIEKEFAKYIGVTL